MEAGSLLGLGWPTCWKLAGDSPGRVGKLAGRAAEAWRQGVFFLSDEASKTFF